MSSSTDPDDKFPFFTEFAEDGRVLHEGSKKFKRYTITELEEASEVARTEALNSVEADTSRRIAASAEAIAAQLAPALPLAIELADRLRRDAGELALTLARKMAGEALNQYPKEAVEACIEACVDLLPKRALIKLKVMPDLVEPMTAQIERLFPDTTTIEVVGDPAAPPGAWSFEWETGALSQNPEELSEQLSSAVEQFLTQPINPQGELFSSVA